MISVIIPVYNAENHIARCIDSILNQTYQEFELILIDDGSTDNSNSICKEYMNNDGRVKLYRNIGKGPGAARNLGIEKSKGKYLYFMDADDDALPDLLQENYQIANKYKVELVCFGYHRIIYKNMKPNDTKKHYHKESYLKSKEDIKDIFWELQDRELIFTLWNKLYNRNFILDNNIKFTNLKKGQDAVFNFDVLSFTSKVYVNEKCYYNYHLYDENNITSRHTPNLFKNYKYFNIRLQDLFKKWDMKDAITIDKINEIRLINTVTSIFNLIKYEKNKLNKSEKIKECQKILKDPSTEELIKALNLNKIKSQYRRVCYLLMVTRSPILNLNFYRLIQFIKRRL